MGNFLIFPSKHFLAGGSSLLEPKNQPMHTDATYGTCDKLNYALEGYQVVLGCLGVHKTVFTKIAVRSELLAPSQNHRTVSWSKLLPFSSITIDTAYVVWFWRLYNHEKEFRTPRSVPWNSAMGRLFSGSFLPNYCKLLAVKTVLKHMVRFSNAYSVDSSCN